MRVCADTDDDEVGGGEDDACGRVVDGRSVALVLAVAAQVSHLVASLHYCVCCDVSSDGASVVHRLLISFCETCRYWLLAV